MFALLVVACTFGTPDCRSLQIANEFPDFKTCTEVSEMLVLKTWEQKHPKDYILSWACTDSPNYYLYRYHA